MISKILVLFLLMILMATAFYIVVLALSLILEFVVAPMVLAVGELVMNLYIKFVTRER